MNSILKPLVKQVLAHPSMAVKQNSTSPAVSPRRLSAEKQAFDNSEFTILLASDIIQPSRSPQALPLNMVLKKDGVSQQLCSDYRALNAGSSHGINKFPKFNLVRAHQIPNAIEDVEKTAVTTSSGMFQFPHIPFGLVIAAHSLQRFMGSITRDFDSVHIYIDDLLIAKPKAHEHIQQLTTLFESLSDKRILANPTKFGLGKTELKFLGHQITREDTRNGDHKARTALGYTVPSSIQELIHFHDW